LVSLGYPLGCRFKAHQSDNAFDTKLKEHLQSSFFDIGE
jgi:hypothetical protein